MSSIICQLTIEQNDGATFFSFASLLVSCFDFYDFGLSRIILDCPIYCSGRDGFVVAEFVLDMLDSHLF